MNAYKAYAKINLRLRVLAREESGYHSIETLFQRIELHDVVHVARASDRSIHCHGPAMPTVGLGPDTENLAFRAAAEYMKASGLDDGFRIEIEKRIPVGGGLGGGSANAAAVLHALQDECDHALEHDAGYAIAATLGSDVPFMLSGLPLALAWGHGERMIGLPALDVRAVHLYAFGDGVNTGEAYKTLSAAGATGSGGSAYVAHAGDLSSWEGVQQEAVNDFESVVAAMHSGVRETLSALRAGSKPEDIVMLSGSGATCFRIPLGGDTGDAGKVAIEPVGGAQLLMTHTLT